MGLHIDRVDFEHGTPDSRFELLASAALADLGDSIKRPHISFDDVHVFSDMTGYARYSNVFDYCFRIVESRPVEEVTKSYLLQGKAIHGNHITIARTGEEGEGRVGVSTCSLVLPYESLVDLGSIVDDEEFMYELGKNFIKTADVRIYDAEFETRLVELVREQALLKEEITV